MTKLNKIKWLMITTLLICVGLSACTENQPDSSTTPTQSTVPTAADISEARQTGIAVLDEIMDAALTGDGPAVAQYFEFINIPCTTEDGLGGPPKCLENEADGTLVEVLPIFGPEGHFLRKDSVKNWQLPEISEVYAVYAVSETVEADEYYPIGDYAIVLIINEGRPGSLTFQVKAEKIVRLDYGFELPPVISLDGVKEYILPPTGNN